MNVRVKCIKRFAMIMLFTLLSASRLEVSPFGVMTVKADTTTANQALRFVQQYKSIFNYSSIASEYR
ncbi:hypothetical protein [Paenibacillus aceris]|uniref:Uncharacterized protein n=1 Tax=Paenibacillus aceris TaxID=869555 RepID=A0ABS4I208_9BACL|nr:hypothetical protein [Paenibacillus aceris]MBP1964952.1 hypothetical protein [Paenibacillus aceris]NHW35613.1 hypothetical protein [Paenibacillus aceris]